MAGRGRDAVLPAWMKAGGATGAPGAAATPAASAPSGAPSMHPSAPAQAMGPRPGLVPARVVPPQAYSGAPRAATAMPGALPGGGYRPVAPVAADWTEHKAPDGRTYYYNTRLKTSSWERPEGMPGSGGGGGSDSDWKEFTAPDGRKYYYNRVTKESRWTKPDGAGGIPMPGSSQPAVQPAAPQTAKPASAHAVAVAPAAQVVKLTDKDRSAAAVAAAGGSGSYIVPSGALQPGPTPHYATTAEAKDAFKQMLADACIPINLSWDETLRAVVSDRRFGALKTLGERKAAFHEYLAQRKREEAEEARQRRMQAKEGFHQLLDSCTALRAPPQPAKFSKARDLLELDPRWQAVDSDREREELFVDWLDEVERMEREDRKAEEKRRRAAFRELLESSAWIKSDTSWRKAQERLAGEEAYEAVERAARLEVWGAFQGELEGREREARERAKEERRRQERRNRDAFRELLAKHTGEGVITAKTRWKDYLPLIADEPALAAVEGNTSGSRPKELFLDALEEAEAEYEKERAALKLVLAAAPVNIGVDTSFDEFQLQFAAALGALGAPSTGDADADPTNAKISASASAVGEPSLRTFFAEVQGEAREAKERAEKEARRAQDEFLRLLKHTRSLGPGSSYEQAEEECGREREWTGVPGGEEERRALFAEFLSKAAAREAERAERDAERAQRKRSASEDERVLSGSGSDGEGGSRREKDRERKRSKHHKRHKREHRRRSRSRERRGSGRHNEEGEVEEGEVA